MQHIVCIPAQLIKYVLAGQWDFLIGFQDALKRLPSAIKRRREESHERSYRSDDEIFDLSKAIG